jgi:hypothetical protein
VHAVFSSWRIAKRTKQLRLLMASMPRDIQTEKHSSFISIARPVITRQSDEPL